MSFLGEVNMGGLYFSKGSKKEVCISAWARMTKAGLGGGTKDQSERSPRGEEMGREECFLIQ